jgi:hypothetical protein
MPGGDQIREALMPKQKGSADTINAPLTRIDRWVANENDGVTNAVFNPHAETLEYSVNWWNQALRARKT